MTSSLTPYAGLGIPATASCAYNTPMARKTNTPSIPAISATHKQATTATPKLLLDEACFRSLRICATNAIVTKVDSRYFGAKIEALKPAHPFSPSPQTTNQPGTRQHSRNF